MSFLIGTMQVTVGVLLAEIIKKMSIKGQK